MGFFQSLKDDLSVAVNELVNEDDVEAKEKSSEEVDPLIPDLEEDTLEEETKEEDKKDSLDSKDEKTTENVSEKDKSDENLTEKEKMETTDSKAIEEDPMQDVDLDQMLTDLTEEPTNEEAVKETAADSIEKDEKAKEEGKKMDDMTQRPISEDNALITCGMTITGNIETDGNMEVFGVINGNLNIAGKLNISGTICGDSKANEVYAEGAEINGEVEAIGSVKVGQSTVIIGNVTATSAVIAGAVKGDIDVKGPVILDSSAIVMGNIKSQSVQISNGAVIEGMCSQCYATVNPTSFFEEFKKTVKASSNTKNEKKA